MQPNIQSTVLFHFLLFSSCFAHSSSQNGETKSGAPLFGSVMRYFGESETGYGLPSSGLFDNVDTSSSVAQQQVSTCLPNFEVSVGSIIRTKDSQYLGAHYLNETDLGAKSRDECLRLCCKVPRCNVAVFEEKNSGSCYLFDCGNIDDTFRCKFTSQAHYVSAILRRQSPDHSSNSGSIMDAHINGHNHNQHEDELSQLRGSDKVPAIPGVSAAVVASETLKNGDIKSKQSGGDNAHGGGSGIVTSSSSTPIPILLTVDGASGGASRRCSRWQFECKSSGECIAIYNVCDQIPNCPDGSDESPELHCPANNGYAPGAETSVVKQKGTSSTTINQQQQPLSQMHHPQPPVPITGVLEKPHNNGAEASPTDLKSPFRHNEEYPLLKSQQNAGNGIVTVPRKNEIFTHKDNGLMDETYINHPQQQPMHNYGPFWKQPNYDYGNGDSSSANLYGPLPPPPQFPINANGNPFGTNANYGNNGQYQYAGYPNMQGPQQQQSNSQGLVMQASQPVYPGRNSNYNLQNNSPQQPQPQQPYYNGQQVQVQGTNNNGVVPINNPAAVLQQQPQANNVRNGVPSQGSSNNLNPSSQLAQVTTMKPAVGPQVQNVPKISNTNSVDNKNSLSKIESEFIKSLKAQSLQSGSSEVQSEELSPHTAGAGAVFIFILGLGMSIVMVIIVGCRLRRVGRRQRGKNRLDPDYLVDGMYL